MSRVLLCIGSYAKTPYFMEKSYTNVYCAEELCYCLMRDAYLLDQEIMDGKLPEWLDKECGLPELSELLYQALREGSSVSRFVGIILEYTGYGEAKERERIQDSLEKGVGLSAFEKRKARADYLVETKRYMPALKDYKKLLKELPETETALRAGIYHNRGVVCTKLFRFESAAENFKKAWECGGKESSHFAYLMASRMRMEEKEYVNFIADSADNYEASLKVEHLMEDAVKEFETTEENRMLFTLKVCKAEETSVSYYEEIERIIEELKEQYRQNASE